MLFEVIPFQLCNLLCLAYQFNTNWTILLTVCRGACMSWYTWVCPSLPITVLLYSLLFWNFMKLPHAGFHAVSSVNVCLCNKVFQETWLLCTRIGDMVSSWKMTSQWTLLNLTFIVEERTTWQIWLKGDAKSTSESLSGRLAWLSWSVSGRRLMTGLMRRSEEKEESIYSWPSRSVSGLSWYRAPN